MRKIIRCTFPPSLLREPLLHHVNKTFAVVPNIRAAEIGEESGWMDLELEGIEGEIERVVEYLRSRGVGVEAKPQGKAGGM
jgi:hypothetical protein